MTNRPQRTEPSQQSQRPPQADTRVLAGAVGAAMLGGALGGPLWALIGFVVGASVTEGVNQQQQRKGGR